MPTTYGRESAASRVTPTFEAPRPQPPDELSPLGKQVWRDITEAFKPTWFQGAEHVLTAYCGMVLTERQIAAELSKCHVEDERYPLLVRLYTSAVATLGRTATKLRLTPQSTRDSRHQKHVVTGKKPWEVDFVDDEPESDLPS